MLDDENCIPITSELLIQNPNLIALNLAFIFGLFIEYQDIPENTVSCFLHKLVKIYKIN